MIIMRQWEHYHTLPAFETGSKNHSKKIKYLDTYTGFYLLGFFPLYIQYTRKKVID